MLEDAAGKGFVLREGTYVGRNSGRVTKIMKEKVVIEEEFEDTQGKIVIFTRELKLNKR
jgi:type IV pilus assembly protein PilP